MLFARGHLNLYLSSAPSPLRLYSPFPRPFFRLADRLFAPGRTKSAGTREDVREKKEKEENEKKKREMGEPEEIEELTFFFSQTFSKRERERERNTARPILFVINSPYPIPDGVFGYVYTYGIFEVSANIRAYEVKANVF